MSKSAVEGMVARIGAYGSLVGWIDTLSCDKQLCFTLYEALRGDPIRCYFEHELSQDVCNARGHQVQVVGWVVREASSGRPVQIRRVRQVVPLDEGDGPDLRATRGAIPWQEGMLTAVDAIRRERDS